MCASETACHGAVLSTVPMWSAGVLISRAHIRAPQVCTPLSLPLAFSPSFDLAEAPTTPDPTAQDPSFKLKGQKCGSSI